MSIMDKWINKMWHIHTTVYCSAIKYNEVLTYATTWVNLDNIMLSERSPSRNTKGQSRMGVAMEKKVVHWLLRAGGRAEMGGRVTAKGCGISLCGEGNCINWLRWWLHITMNILKAIDLYTSNGWIIKYMNYVSTNPLKTFQWRKGKKKLGVWTILLWTMNLLPIVRKFSYIHDRHGKQDRRNLCAPHSFGLCKDNTQNQC